MYLLYSLQTNHSKLILQPLHAACKEAVETVDFYVFENGTYCLTPNAHNL
jgi:hypothetical protein